MNLISTHPVRHLVIVCSNYPAPWAPTNGTFVQQLVHAVARQGVRCSVIHPVPIHEAIRQVRFHERETLDVGNGIVVEVFRPRYISVSAREGFAFMGRLSPSFVTLNRFTAAVRRVISHEGLKPDAIYGHFLYLSGAAAIRVGEELGIDAFPGVGEGEMWTVRQFGWEHARRFLPKATAFIANSTALKRILVSELYLSSALIEVFPNGTDLNSFYPRDRAIARERFGLPKDQFLVGAVGNFLEKKGIVRVGQAIDGLEGVAGVFAGSGPVPPQASNTAFCGRVPHNQLPDLLSACDVFALPTVIEGSCNALIEAMACGLPIISSIGEFNDDVLDETMSIRIDPWDVSALRGAIMSLRDDPQRRKAMADAAVRRSREFDVDQRARRILNFMGARLRG
ncbi:MULTISPECIES: glycosyltransferase [Ectothiorhodospira]|uniref:glycosyltransferase n=1 Tax=Ectothiorhodospira TaxID=1051 RepID=UPI0019052A20|nr:MULTISPECIES: glycosyltransferase [Ectothiorhodospira]MBK1674787.1 hypothetical protein [Ectothiorhodospira shaposhnikovii]MCG5501301.1 glycosyltransferase [Ectothiorhodospira lacustris]